MTAKTTVEITATNTNGDPYGRTVKVSLIGSGQGGSVDGQVIVGTTTVHLDATGSGTVALYPNSAITPAGTYYALAVPGTGVVRCITVPSSGPVDWSDNAIQVVDTNDLPVIVPPASAGTTGDALIVNAEGNGYELGAGLTGPQGPAGAAGATGATGPAGADGADGATVDTALTTSADGAPFFRSASTVATWESVAGLVGTPQPVIDQVSGFLPYVVTDAGDTQYGVELNASTLTALALAVAESASAGLVDLNAADLALGGRIDAAGLLIDAVGVRVDDVESGATPIDYTGTGLYTGVAHLNEAASISEGYLDRIVVFRAIEMTANIDVSDFGSAVFQYGDLNFDDGDGGLVDSTKVWLTAQTNPAENGAWTIDRVTLTGTQMVSPDIFEPPGNGGMRLLSNPTDIHHGMLWEYVDASAEKFQRGGGFVGVTPAYPSGFGEWILRHDPTALYLTSPNGTRYAVTVDNAGTLTTTAV